MKKYIILISIIMLAFCSGGREEALTDSHEHTDQEDSHQHEGEPESQGEEESEHQDVHVTREQQKEWGIVLGQAKHQNIASQVTLPGTLALNQNRTAHISSFVHGQIYSLSVDLGSRVQKDRPLVTINSPEFSRTQADFLYARAKMILSQKEYERAKMLFSEKAIEEKEYLRREAEFQKLSTEYAAQESRLHSFGITHDQMDELIKKSAGLVNEEYKNYDAIAAPLLPILSPISGTVIFRDIITGEHIEPEKILFTVSDLRTLWAQIDAYEKDIPFISKNSMIYIQSSLYPDKNFSGKITYISDVIDAKLRTLKVRVEVDNSEGLLKPNMYIQGIIQNQAGQEILAVPEQAIQNIEGEKAVFVPESDEIFTVRHIQTGRKVGNQRIILSGLKIGDTLVIKGAFTLKTELSKATTGSAHVH